MIYLASPYAHEDPKAMIARFDAVTHVAVQLVRSGIPVFSPIAMHHPMTKYQDFPRSWDFWSGIDLPMLSRADSLLVLMLEKWEISIGVSAEIAWANEIGIPLKYLNPSDFGVTSDGDALVFGTD